MSGYEPSSVEVSSLYISFLSSVQFHAWNDKLVVGAQPFYSCCKLILAHHRLTWAVIVRATTTVTVRAFRWCSARGTRVVNGDCVPFGTLGEQSRFLNGRLRVTSYQSPSWQVKRSPCWRSFCFRIWEEHFSTIWSLIISFSKSPKSQDFANSLKIVRYASIDSSAFRARDLNLQRSSTTLLFGANYPSRAVFTPSRVLCSPERVLKMR